MAVVRGHPVGDRVLAGGGSRGDGLSDLATLDRRESLGHVAGGSGDDDLEPDLERLLAEDERDVSGQELHGGAVRGGRLLEHVVGVGGCRHGKGEAHGEEDEDQPTHGLRVRRGP